MDQTNKRNRSGSLDRKESGRKGSLFLDEEAEIIHSAGGGGVRANLIPRGAVRGEGFLQKHRKIYVRNTQLEEPGAGSCLQTNSRKGQQGEKGRHSLQEERELGGWRGRGVALGRERRSNVKFQSCSGNPDLLTHLFKLDWEFNTTPSIILLKGELQCGMHFLSS